METVRDAELYRGLEDKLGATVATGLMERLPPPPVDRLATKDDVGVVSRELEAFRTDVDQRFEKIDERFEKIDERFDRMEQRFNGIDVRFTKVEGQMATMQAELLATVRGELIAGLHSQSRQMVLALVGSLVGLSTAGYLLAQIAA